MKKLTRFSVLAGIIAAILPFVAIPVAAQQCAGDAGPFQAALQPPPDCTSTVGICTLGTLNGKFQQTYYFVMDFMYPANDPAQPNKFIYGGHSVITRVDGGAILYSQDTGVMIFGGDLNTFVTTVNIVGGTKEYSDATGQFVATGQIDFVSGQVNGTFTSTICK
jgi:hypothetical protein